MTLTSHPAWETLSIQSESLPHLRELFASDPARAEKFQLEAAGLFLDYSKNLITSETVACLIDLANAAGRTLPTLLLIVLALSGIVLTINSVILVAENPGRSSFVVLSVVLLVAFDLALLLVLAAPLRGTLQASPKPIESVVNEIDSGFFTR